MRSLKAALCLSALLTVIGTPQARAQCAAPKSWFPHSTTPEPDFHAPHKDCDFHQWGWQTFLWLTQPTGKGRIRLLDLPPADDLFQAGKGPPTLNAAALEALKSRVLVLTPRVAKSDAPTRTTDVRQAGSRGLLVDQKGRAVQYAVHVTPAFYQFVRSNRLFLKDNYLKASPKSNFPVRSVVVKSSWRVLSPDKDAPGFFTTTAEVPTLVCKNGKETCTGDDIVIDRARRERVTVALVGLHVVGVVEDHPEFVWSTFEHVNNAPDLPETMDRDCPCPVDDKPYTFYAAKTFARDCNLGNAGSVKLDAKMKQLSPPTNVFRLFPYGGGDDADRGNVKSLNESVHAQLAADSVWRNYFQVGSLWFERCNDLEPGLEGPKILRRSTGSVRLANTTMETFAQQGRRNCFACHDTGRREDLGLPAMNMNLSHVLINGLLQRDEFARTSAQPIPALAAKAPKSYAEVRRLLDDFVGANNVPLASTAYGAFWDEMDYKKFTEGDIPGVTDPAGKPLKILVVKKSGESNIIKLLRGTRGSVFDPVEGTVGRLPPSGPFMDERDIRRIAEWIDKGCPDEK
jgi:hypothetical protein